MKKSLVFQRKLDAFVGKQGKNPQCMLAMQNECDWMGQGDRASDSSPVTPHCWAWARPLHSMERGQSLFPRDQSAAFQHKYFCPGGGWNGNALRCLTSAILVISSLLQTNNFSFFEGLCTQRQDMDILVLLSSTTAHMPDLCTSAVRAKLNWFCLSDPSSMSLGQDWMHWVFWPCFLWLSWGFI